jgi:diguanylate cyclase (GGDEF)-like protein
MASKSENSATQTPWLEGVPRLIRVAGTMTAIVGLTAILGFLAAGGGRPFAWAEPVLAFLAIGAVLAAPIRLGPALSLGAVTLFLLVDLAVRGRSGMGARSVALAFLLLAALFGASYLRLALRRRETELDLAQETIDELTRRDRITELLTGSRELTWLDAELARARRHHHQLTLVLLRPDGIDDLPEDGDSVREVLEAAAEVVGNELRTTDVALRYDASSFAIILPETTSEGARVAAERVRLLLPQRVSADGLSVSSGIASFPRDASTNAELTAVAQQALDRAVELGGNRTVLASVDDAAPAGWTLASST